MGAIFLMGKTHAAVGVVAGLAVVQPQNIKEIVITVAISFIGGLIADVDIKTSKAGKAADKVNSIIISMFLCFVVALSLDKYFELGLSNMIFDNFSKNKVFFVAIGGLALLYFLLKVIQSSHRGFTHSFLALALISSIGTMFFNTMGAVALSISYISHILIDLFNKKGCQLFYPLKKRYCFKLCKSNGIINDILFFISCFISSLMILQFLFKII